MRYDSVAAMGRTVRHLLAASGLGLTLASSAAAGGGETYDDPFAYCRAVGTVDTPDDRYDGPAMPDLLARKLRAAVGAPDDAPLGLFREGATWRCMDGAVFACTVGANLPCATKADPGRTPSEPMRQFCREQPEGAVIPAVVTGRATVYAWRCAGGEAVPEGTPRAIDPAGFLADIWYRLEPD